MDVLSREDAGGYKVLDFVYREAYRYTQPAVYRLEGNVSRAARSNFTVACSRKSVTEVYTKIVKVIVDSKRLHRTITHKRLVVSRITFEPPCNCLHRILIQYILCSIPQDVLIQEINTATLYVSRRLPQQPQQQMPKTNSTSTVCPP